MTTTSYLSEILDLAVETGRRLTPILSLTYADLRLERTRTVGHGAIRWPAQTDKQGQEWTAPLSERAGVEKQDGSLWHAYRRMWGLTTRRPWRWSLMRVGSGRYVEGPNQHPH